MHSLLERIEQLTEGKTYTGYKVMRTDGKRAIAGADSRQSFPLQKGKVVQFRGNGIYLALDRKYVLTYYSELADREVLLKFQFDVDDIITGNVTDREPEPSVRKAKLVSWELLDPADD